MQITICGGGNLGHVLAGVCSSKGIKTNVLTERPGYWLKNITISDNHNRTYLGEINKVTSNPSLIIPDSDIVILCLPGYLLETYLKKIKPNLRNETLVGSIVSSSGFFWIARNLLGKNIKLFGFQRVPYISRIIEYGKSAKISGYKSGHKIGISNNFDKIEKLKIFFEEILEVKVEILSNYLEAALTNSNPILHPSRMYSLFKNWNEFERYKVVPLFYEEWSLDSSEILIKSDAEFQNVIKQLPINIFEIPSLLKYYNCSTSEELKIKISSIEAFKEIKVPMITTEKGFIPDLQNRYFTEDIPFGLLVIKSLGLLTNQKTPMIDAIIYWGQNLLGMEYLTQSNTLGYDCKRSGIPQNYGITSLKELYEI